MVCSEGTKDVFVWKREGGSGGLTGVSSRRSMVRARELSGAGDAHFERLIRGTKKV